MRRKLGERFGVVFSFAVVVTDTELPGFAVVGRVDFVFLVGSTILLRRRPATVVMQDW